MEALLERLQRLQSYDARGFAEVVVTGTGFSGPPRRALKDMCAAAGIAYSGDLVAGWTTHLVANPACISDAAPKMHAAARWDVPAVRLAWLMESIRQGEPRPVEPYLLMPSAASVAAPPRAAAPLPPRLPREQLTVRSKQGSFHPSPLAEPTALSKSYPSSSVVGVMPTASEAPAPAASEASASPCAAGSEVAGPAAGAETSGPAAAARSPLSEVCNVVEAQLRRLTVTPKPARPQREEEQRPREATPQAMPLPLDSPALPRASPMQQGSDASLASLMEESKSKSSDAAPMQESSEESLPAAAAAGPASASKPMSPEWWNQGDGIWVPGSQPRTDPMALGTPAGPPRATAAEPPSLPSAQGPTPAVSEEEISLAPPSRVSDSESGGSDDDDGATPTPLKGPLSRLQPGSFSFGVEPTPAEPTPPAPLSSKGLATPDTEATPLNVAKPAATTHVAETQSEALDSPGWGGGGSDGGNDGFGEPSCWPEVPFECGGQPRWDAAAVGTPAAEEAVTPPKSAIRELDADEDPICSSTGGRAAGEEATPSPPSSSGCSNRSPSPQVVARARAPLPPLPPLPSGLGDEPPDDTVALKLLQRAPRGSTVKARYRLANTKMVSFAEEVHVRGLKLTLSVKDKDNAIVLGAEFGSGSADSEGGAGGEGPLLADPVSLYRVMGECWQMEYHRLYTGPQALAAAAAAGVRLRLPPGFDASRELLRGVAREHADMRRVHGTAAVRRVRLGVNALRTRGAAGEAPAYYWRCQIDAEGPEGPQVLLPEPK